MVRFEMAVRSFSFDYKDYLTERGIEPGENFIVKRLPCVECGAESPRYIMRRLCARCYHRQAKRRGLGLLTNEEQFHMWTLPYDGHLLWIGSIKNPQGYGALRREYAHRWSYEHFVGPIPDGLVIDHLCSRRWCVNPDHLEPVTQAENVRRWTSALTHCKWGHVYDEANTYRDPKTGARGCRTCARLRAAGTHPSREAS